VSPVGAGESFDTQASFGRAGMAATWSLRPRWIAEERLISTRTHLRAQQPWPTRATLRPLRHLGRPSRYEARCWKGRIGDPRGVGSAEPTSVHATTEPLRSMGALREVIADAEDGASDAA
jgi:hypothetical protein